MKTNTNNSAILGGYGNTVKHNYAAVFGNGITTVRNNTFHIGSLYIDPATIPTAASAIAGIIWSKYISPGMCQLMIS